MGRATDEALRGTLAGRAAGQVGCAATSQHAPCGRRAAEGTVGDGAEGTAPLDPRVASFTQSKLYKECGRRRPGSDNTVTARGGGPGPATGNFGEATALVAVADVVL